MTAAIILSSITVLGATVLFVQKFDKEGLELFKKYIKKDEEE